MIRFNTITGQRAAGSGRIELLLSHCRLLLSAGLLVWQGMNPVVAQAPRSAHWCGICQLTQPVHRDSTTSSGTSRLIAQGIVPAAFTPYGSIGNKKVLIMRVDVSDLPDSAATVATITNSMAAVNSFYQSSSFEQMAFTVVDLTLVLRLPQTSATYVNSLGIVPFMTDAYAAARSAGYEPNNYDFCIANYGFSFGAPGFGSGKNCWIEGANFDSGLVSHELGHTMNLPHAYAWRSPTIIGAGQTIEYGHEFDVMVDSGAFPNGHFNVNFKFLLGWIPNSNLETVTSSGTYRIFAADGGGALNPARRYGLRIPAGITNTGFLADYWVEHRYLPSTRPSTLADGVLVMWGSDTENGANRLLDTTPLSGNEFFDSPVPIGSSFTDPNKRITIAPLVRGGSGSDIYVDVQVTLNSTIGPPTFLVQPATQTVGTGANVTLSVTATSTVAIAYQWERYGYPVLGATNPTLSLPNLTIFQAGDYSVTLSNSLSSVRSAIGSLVVTNTRPGTTNSLPVPAGLIAWWTADGHAEDVVGVAHGTALNGTRYSTGLRGLAFNLDG